MLAAAIVAGPVAAVGQTGEPETALSEAAAAVESQRLYLSGTGPDDPVGWEFRIDSGRGAGEWRVIPVPSNWELEGFGRYTHGKQWWRPAEKAIYRTRFVAPPDYRGRRVELVFEGVMTDAEVLLNGRPAGEVHRGGYTRFAYDVSTMLWFHRPNRLEVRVAEESADPSVNRAEREADYWIFGGIYRPVYLEAHPAASITRVKVDARHDGRLKVDVATVGAEPAEVRAQVETLAGEPVGETLAAAIDGDRGARIEGTVEGVEPWSAEFPNLYRLRLELAEPGGEPLHRRYVRIGFRTVEPGARTRYSEAS
ncbi:MAG: glycoside hydrolase family 2 protein, partial [Thermoanaerobaculia bacterium]